MPSISISDSNELLSFISSLSLQTWETEVVDKISSTKAVDEILSSDPPSILSSESL